MRRTVLALAAASLIGGAILRFGGTDDAGCVLSDEEIIRRGVEHYIQNWQGRWYRPDPTEGDSIIEYHTFPTPEDLLAAAPDCCRLIKRVADMTLEAAQADYDFRAIVVIDPPKIPVGPPQPNPLAGRTWRVALNSCGEFIDLSRARVGWAVPRGPARVHAPGRSEGG